MKDCIFCKIIKGELPCFKVYEDDKCLAFEDINPIAKGHTLIIPKVHAENLWEIPDDYLTGIHLASKKIIHAIKGTLNPDGVAAIQLNGRGVNQVVMHYHLHLIPREKGGPALSMTEWKLGEGDMEMIRQTGEKIALAIR